MNLTQKSFIDGQWVETHGQPFTGFDPVQNHHLDTYLSAGVKEADIAVRGAYEAYQSFKNLSGIKRADFLERLALEIESLGDILLETANKETALGLPRLTGERARTCNQIRAFAQLIREGSWTSASIDSADSSRVPPKPDLRRMLRPIGPVLVFPASNFPLAFGLLGGDTASALAAGNPVVIKAHPAHPATSELCMIAAERALQAVNLPLSTISMLQSSSLELAQHLVKHPDIQAVGFTGSLKAGRSIMDLAAKRPTPIPVYAEMGSTNPVFITPKALQTRGSQIAKDLAASISLGTGQFCTSPGVVVALQDQDFVEQLSTQLSQAPQGTLLNPTIATGLKSGLTTQATNSNITVITGGDSLDEAGLRPLNSLLATSAEAFLSDERLHEEIFGPVCLYVACKNEEEMLQVAQATQGNLTGTIHAESDDNLSAALAEQLAEKVGRLIFNAYPTGVEVCPSQQHGGPYPACSVASTTSVGTGAITRFVRFVAYQDLPQQLLPAELKDFNELNVLRLVNGNYSRDAI